MASFSATRKYLKRRALAKGLECSISADTLAQKWRESDHCPICRSKYFDEMNHPHGRSFDRFDSSIGYTAGNVTVMCRDCNSVKSVFDRDGEGELLRVSPLLGSKVLAWIYERRRTQC